MRDDEIDYRRGGIGIGKFLLFAFGLIIVFVILGSLTGIITSPFRMASGVVERTLNPDNAIANYEWFKRQNEDVQAITNKIALAQTSKDSFEKSAGNRESWKFEDRQEYNRLNNVLLGLQSQREQMIAEYNARSQMANRTLFKSNNLPESL